ncbi:tyrosyl-DNA phosphodiesterase 2 isoform X4 [Nothobranchius furzeri]|uniref:tyrosyl-DNA phosphodiesterase 2 isoform X4 n=1 Tax=Nothobranchius furzeri TaxID=105023 RepID=UPI003904D3C8
MASSSDTHQPSVSDVEKDRTRLCEEFASITGNHSDVAQCYLAENDWQMERALNSFFEADMERVFEEDFEENDTPKKKQKVEKTPPEDCIDLTKDSPAAQKPTDEDDNKLSLMSWNVDGLDSDNLQERARGLCSFLVLWPKWVFLRASVTCGSDSADRSTAATPGTPKLTTTSPFPSSAAAASTASSSVPLPKKESRVCTPITWPWWGWRSWTVAVSLVTTGGFTAASLLSRN